MAHQCILASSDLWENHGKNFHVMCPPGMHLKILIPTLEQKENLHSNSQLCDFIANISTKQLDIVNRKEALQTKMSHKNLA